MAKNKTESETAPPQQQVPAFEHTEDFASLYADNVRFESTVWDLKLIFGEIDLSSGSEIVKQHTAITIPWSLAKLVIFFLQLNVSIQELLSGTVIVPPSQIPPPAPPLTPEQKADPNAVKIKELARKTRDEFIS